MKRSNSSFLRPAAGFTEIAISTPVYCLSSDRITSRGTIVSITGDLDYATCEELQTVLLATAACGGPGPLVLDLEGVRFMCSRGISLLLLLHRRLTGSGRQLVARGLRPAIRKALETVGLLGMFAGGGEVTGSRPGVAAVR